MGGLNITFLWHMHQPYYRDPFTGTASMPWVRMHACKAYTDMCAMLENHGVKVVINLVPSLLMQLQEYADGANDVFLEVARKPVSDLTADERMFVLDRFFSANFDTMVKPYPRYRWLFEKRRHGGWLPAEEIVDRFSDVEMRDLVVWFHLAWMGYTVRKEHPEIAELTRKGWNFTEEEKAKVLEIGLENIKTVILRLKKLVQDGKVELTTTPLFHPIIPLLIDTDIARRCMPWARLPKEPFRYPEDALEQIKLGREYFKNIFEEEPRGVWPSEGSVCPEIVPMLAEAGFKWFATDEDIILETIKSRDRQDNIYQPWLVEHEGCSLVGLFRDRVIADKIGFDYPKMKEEDAASDLIGRLKGIRQATRAWASPPLVLIALDGENAWEYYPKGGEDFLNILYDTLEKDSDFNTVLPKDFLEAHPPSRKVSGIHSGSWIRHDYSVWIGGEEENEAWDRLVQTRRYFAERIKNFKPPTLTRGGLWQFLISLFEHLALATARRELFAGEGSDWFWWYGDEFTSDMDDEFDRLFRVHLKNVYRFLGDEYPEILDEPIAKPHPVKPDVEPIAFLHPIIDGKVTHYYEWCDGARYTVRAVGSTMYTKEVYIEKIYYGFDADNFYLRLDRRELAWMGEKVNGETLEKPLPDKVIVSFRINGQEMRVEIPAEKGENLTCLLVREGFDTHEIICPPGKAATDEVMEISMPFKMLGFYPNTEVKFSVVLERNGRELDRYPKNGFLSFVVPDKDFERRMWSA